jgi:hypothetical protein
VNKEAIPAKKDPMAKGSIKNVGTKSSANNRTAAAINQICVIMTI